MKRSIIILSLLYLVSCGKEKTYWNPQGKFSMLNGENQSLADSSQFFSLDSVSADTNIVILNFFAPHCKPCIEELPDLKALYPKLKETKGVDFFAIGSILGAIGVGADSNESEVKNQVSQFVKEYKIEYPIYIASTNSLTDFGITGFPETFVLYRNGKGWLVKRRYISSITEEDILPYLIKGASKNQRGLLPSEVLTAP